MENRLPEKLTMIRKNYGWPQGEIAEKIGVPVTEYMKWENGSSIPTIALLKKTADLMGIPLDALVNNTKNIVLPNEDPSTNSVMIPFMDEFETTEEMAPLAATIQMQTATDDGKTKVMTTLRDETQGNTINADRPLAEPEQKPAHRTPSHEDKSKITKYIIGGAVLLVLAIIGLILLVTGGGSGKNINSVGSTNRLAVGDTYTLYIDKNGSLQTYGTFAPSESFTGAVQVSAYESHALGLMADGTVVSTDGNAEVAGWTEIVSVAAGRTHSVGVTKKGEAVCTGSEAACQVSGWTDIDRVYAGNAITLALTSDGTVRASGSEVAAFDGISGYSGISVGETQILLITKEGTVESYAIGGSTAADTSSWTNVTDAVCGDGFAIALKSDGTCVMTGGTEEQQKTVAEWANIRYIDSNSRTVVVVDKAGALHGIGDNTYKQYTETEKSPEPTEETTKLDSVKNVSFTATTGNIRITWDAVKNADYYTVTFSPELKTSIPELASNSASIASSSLDDGQTYTITITAHADDKEEFEDSEPVSVNYTYEAKTIQLSSPSGLTAETVSNGWRLTWNPVEHAAYYTIALEGYTPVRVDTPEAVLGTDYGLLDGMSYNITIVAVSENATYTDSEPYVSQQTFLARKFTVTFVFADSAGTTVSKTVGPGTYNITDILSESELPAGYQLSDIEGKTITVTDSNLTYQFSAPSQQAAEESGE